MAVSGFTLVWLLSGWGFAHYGLIAIPYFCISILEMKHIYEYYRHKNVSKVLVIVFSAYVAIILLGAIHSYRLYLNLYQDNQELKEARAILAELPSDYKTSFVAYNCTPDLYLYNEITPYYPYFSLQDFEKRNSPSLSKRVYDTFVYGDVKWILVRDIETCTLKKELLRRYDIYIQHDKTLLTVLRSKK